MVAVNGKNAVPMENESRQYHAALFHVKEALNDYR